MLGKEDPSSSSASSDDDQLDEEDLELLEENTGRRVRSKKQFKRLKKRRIGDESSTEEHFAKLEGHGNNLENIFEDDDEETRPSPSSKRTPSPVCSDDEGLYEEEDDIADFIEEDPDDDAEIEERAGRLNKSSRSSSLAYSGGAAGRGKSSISASRKGSINEYAEICYSLCTKCAAIGYCLTYL